MAHGVRIFQDAPGRWNVRTVAELSRWQRTPAGRAGGAARWSLIYRPILFSFPHLATLHSR